MSLLVLIPARGGSKGLPGKNIKELGGKPLIYYSIDVARSLFKDEQICVSTDDIAIKECVEKYPLKVPFLRPAHLAADNSGTYEVILHALSHYESLGIYFNSVLLLQPTSPFREQVHIEDVLKLKGLHPNAEMIVSVKESKDNPYFNLFEEDREGYLHKSKSGDFIRRQDCPPVFAFNGSIYLMKTEALKEKKISEFKHIVKYVMDEKYSVDIDTQRDWDLQELVMGKNK